MLALELGDSPEQLSFSPADFVPRLPYPPHRAKSARRGPRHTVARGAPRPAPLPWLARCAHSRCHDAFTRAQRACEDAHRSRALLSRQSPMI
jgi:hypothetical protein